MFETWLSTDFWLNLAEGQRALLPWLIGTIALLETLAFVGLLLPGVAILFALAAVAGSLQFPLLPLLLSAFAGAVLGDLISFLLGRYAAPHLSRLPPLRHNPHWQARGERFFARHGGLSIVIGRFVGPIRPVIPFVAGGLGMSPALFLLYNLLSALAWAPAYLLPGYLTGRSSDWLPRLNPTLLTALILLITLALLLQQIHLRLHPQASLWHWLQQRQLTPSSWGARMLLLLSSTLFVVLVLLQFSGLAAAFNLRLFELLYRVGLGFPNLSQALTHAGDPPLLLGLALLVALLTQALGRTTAARRAGWGLLLAFGAVLLLNHLLKEWLQVARPPLGQALLESFSFPSGHASAASAFYALSAVWLLRGRSHDVRHLGYVLSGGLIVLVALSRVWLGVHWPLDVAAGVLEGVAAAALYRLWLESQPESILPRPLPVLLLGGASVLIYSLIQLRL